MNPLDVIELKQYVAGLSEIMWTYVVELVAQGFTTEQALRLASDWQTAVLHIPPRGES